MKFGHYLAVPDEHFKYWAPACEVACESFQSSNFDKNCSLYNRWSFRRILWTFPRSSSWSFNMSRKARLKWRILKPIRDISDNSEITLFMWKLSPDKQTTLLKEWLKTLVTEFKQLTCSSAASVVSSSYGLKLNQRI